MTGGGNQYVLSEPPAVWGHSPQAVGPLSQQDVQGLGLSPLQRGEHRCPCGGAGHCAEGPWSRRELVALPWVCKVGPQGTLGR